MYAEAILEDDGDVDLAIEYIDKSKRTCRG